MDKLKTLKKRVDDISVKNFSDTFAHLLPKEIPIKKRDSSDNLVIEDRNAPSRSPVKKKWKDYKRLYAQLGRLEEYFENALESSEMEFLTKKLTNIGMSVQNQLEKAEA